MLRYLLQIALLIAAAIYAWRRGGRPERGVAATLVAIAAIDPVMHWILGTVGRYDTLNVVHAAIDFGGFCALLAIALKADRIWTLWAASAQLLALTSHGLRMLEIPMAEIVYAVVTRAPFYILILMLIAGTWLEHRRRRRIPAA